MFSEKFHNSPLIYFYSTIKIFQVQEFETYFNLSNGKMNIFILKSLIIVQRLQTMKEKCTKYEALFTFRSEEELMEHINTCEDCRLEHEKMQNVSKLLQEVKPYYKEKRKNIAKIKVACVLFMLMVSTTTLGVINLNQDVSDTLKYGAALSAEDLGLPVDSYGLIYIE